MATEYEVWDDMEEAPEPGDPSTTKIRSGASRPSNVAEDFAADSNRDDGDSMQVCVREVGKTEILCFRVTREIRFDVFQIPYVPDAETT